MRRPDVRFYVFALIVLVLVGGCNPCDPRSYFHDVCTRECITRSPDSYDECRAKCVDYAEKTYCGQR